MDPVKEAAIVVCREVASYLDNESADGAFIPDGKLLVPFGVIMRLRDYVKAAQEAHDVAALPSPLPRCLQPR